MSDHDDDGPLPGLDAWTPMAPPPGFADRVVAQLGAPAATAVSPLPARRRRWPLVAGVLAATAVAAAATFAITRHAPIDHADAGSLVATARTTQPVGDRAIAVAEPSAALDWHIDASGAAEVEQRAGDVFYRVESGGPFVVHTPAGTVRVTGTCFRIQVLTEESTMPLSKAASLIASGAIGAAVATGVLVTVYEGRVVAQTKSASTEIPAGSHATLDTGGSLVAAGGPATGPSGPGKPVIIMRTPDGTPPIDTAKATRDELVAYTQSQTMELAKLRTRVAELEAKRPGGDSPDSNGDGRPWHDPSPETLKEWAKECRIQADEPGFDHWQPLDAIGKTNPMGLEASELPAFNEALSEVQKQWRDYVRVLYIEATGDTAGADTLSIDAMRNEIMAKSAEPSGSIEQAIANERAGLAVPPADLSKTTPAERMMRMYVQLGDLTEQALAKRLGKERASAIRGDGWGSRSRIAGCPSKADGDGP